MAVNNVLVVDDSPAQLDHLKQIVEQAGRRVTTATSGEEALKKVKSSKPDLVLMDIVMDDLDGYGACRQIIKDEETSHIPVVFVSTKSSRADRLWASKQGGKELITKPYDDEQIVSVLDKY